MTDSEAQFFDDNVYPIGEEDTSEGETVIVEPEAPKQPSKRTTKAKQEVEDKPDAEDPTDTPVAAKAPAKPKRKATAKQLASLAKARAVKANRRKTAQLDIREEIEH